MDIDRKPAVLDETSDRPTDSDEKKIMELSKELAIAEKRGNSRRVEQLAKEIGRIYLKRAQ